MDKHWIWQMALASVAVILIIRYANSSPTLQTTVGQLYAPNV